MTDGLQNLRDDVAFMRGLAEQGGAAPLLGGSILAAAGALFAPASLAHWAVLSRRIDLEAPAAALAVNLIWFTAAAAFLVALFALKHRLRATPGAYRGANQTFSTAMHGVGLSSFALWGAFVVASVRTGEWVIMDMFSVVILALYGGAWVVAAAVSRRRWLNLVASAAFVLAVATAWLIGRPEFYLAYAAALVLTALVPGLVLTRQARAAA